MRQGLWLVAEALKALLEPFGSTRYHTDAWGAYTRHLAPAEPNPGKRHTQPIERTHLTDGADPDHALNPQDDLLFPSNPAA